MASRRQLSGLPVYGLPYPTTSAIGRQKAMELIGSYAGALAKLYGRAMVYGQEELGEHTNSLMDVYGRIMGPAQQMIEGHKGMLGVMHASLLGDAERKIADSREALVGMQLRQPPSQFVNGHGPSQFVNGHGATTSPTIQRGLPFVNGHPRPPVVPVAPPVNAPPVSLVSGHWDHVSSCWVGNPPPFFPFAQLGLPIPPAPVPFFTLGGAPDNCHFPAAAWYGFTPQTLLALCLCSGTQAAPPISGPIGSPVIGSPIGSPQCCPQCGCPIDSKGSSCDNPLYIVVCIPKRKPTVCPPPKPTDSSSGTARSRR